VDVLQHNRDMMSLEKVKLEAQVAMLTKAGGACCSVLAATTSQTIL